MHKAAGIAYFCSFACIFIQLAHDLLKLLVCQFIIADFAATEKLSNKQLFFSPGINLINSRMK